MTALPTRRPVRRFFRVLFPLVAVLVAFGLGVLWPTLHRPALRLDQDSVYPGARARASWNEADGGVIDVRPDTGQAHTLLVLYPGGLVRPQAYQWIGTALAPLGVETVIVRFPLDLAVLGTGRADAVIRRYGAGKTVYLAGHSLGGAMAAQYVSGHAGQVAGLILMGAYPAGNVSLASQTGLRVLDLMGEHDEVAKKAAVQDGLTRLPAQTRLVTVRGSVHSFFGRYGPQAGDGTPTVTHAQAEAQIVAELSAFLAGP
ncbi:alpha/beta hydrolase [Deinococcus sp. KNUC1210]|uniref:alpha/beta hydrolase n=1 Tax=Deinococcus sp. KNUC1210 TaxID=2917691 RepID=UPI001EEF93D3|nr:alpha/beta hydrolase [Deinococcus sp. KNUC1210]ULH15073.1 alpha/beta hydrolase [Deinococcus sp. KNUC1210]